MVLSGDVVHGFDIMNKNNYSFKTKLIPFFEKACHPWAPGVRKQKHVERGCCLTGLNVLAQKITQFACETPHKTAVQGEEITLDYQALLAKINATRLIIEHENIGTDKPKGVLLSEDALISKVVSLATASEASDNDVALSILPYQLYWKICIAWFFPVFA